MSIHDGMSRKTPSRRRFLQGAGLSATLGIAIPYQKFLPRGMIPIAMAQAADELVYLNDKSGLTLMNDRPLNAETPPHLLDDEVTPNERMFVRNNGLVPSENTAAGWTLRIDGEVENELALSIDDLRNDFEVVTRPILVECGGNGRAFFEPGASGNQWTFGAVGCPEWTGVRLRDVLNAAGLRESAVYTAHEGNDIHLSGEEGRFPISRGVPIDKAMDEGNLIAFAMNGGDIPLVHGHPLRLVIPGWPGSASHKYLNRIWIRDQEHDGQGMTGYSYRLPAYPVPPGQEVPPEDMVVFEAMPVKSLITFPETGVAVAPGEALEVRGHAWAGDTTVEAVDVTIDFGQTWQRVTVDAPAAAGAWQRWRGEVTLPQRGYYEVWARATDANGRTQPIVVPGWNPRGYGNNMVHRIALFAEG